MTIVFATNNAHKLEEARAILADTDINLLSLSDIDCHDDIPETAPTLEGNALLKARWVHSRYGHDCIADDTGLMVDALDGAPGVFSARYAGPGHDSKANMDLLLRNMEGITDRRAHFSTAIALISNGEEHTFEGRVDGTIATEPTGTDGFGYDPVFVPAETGISFASMTPEAKNAISHRGRALQLLRKFLAPIFILLATMGLSLNAAAESWRLFPSYNGETQRIIDTKKHTYFLAQMQEYNVNNSAISKLHLNLFRYDKEGDEWRALNASNLLQGSVFRAAEYNFDNNYLAIAYHDGTIDLLRDDDTVLSVPCLKIADVSLSRNIYGISFVPEKNRIYLATEFGYVVVDDRTGDIISSRKLGKRLNAVALIGNNVVVSADNKLYIGRESDTQFSAFVEVPGCLKPQRIARIAPDRLYILYDETWQTHVGTLTLASNGTPKFTQVSTQREYAMEPSYRAINLVGGSKLRRFDAANDYKEFSITIPEGDRSIPAATYDGRQMWFSHGKKGYALKRIPQPEDTDRTWTILKDDYLPNASNVFIAGDMLYTEDYGMLVRNHGVTPNFSSAYYRTPDLISGYKDMTWTSLSYPYRIPDAGLVSYLPKGIARDPQQPNHIYSGSMFSGMLRYDLENPEKSLIFSQPDDVSNKFAGFVAAVSHCDWWPELCEVSAPTFDNAGNLWAIFYDGNNNSDGQHSITLWCWTPEARKATTSPSTFRRWTTYDFEGYFNGSSHTILPLRSSSSKNLVVFSGGNPLSPLIVLDNNGTVTQKGDDRTAVMSTIYDQDGISFTHGGITCLYEDTETSTVWVGCEIGVFTVNPSLLFESPTSARRIKVSRNDGTNLADYLLDGIRVNAITSDPTGDKWFATTGGGLVRTSSDGKTIRKTYTETNSMLPSNTVHSLAYNPTSNSMMISTDMGLCELFLSGSGDDDADNDAPRVYPNPVRPGYAGYVTIDNIPEGAMVKVTDVQGNMVKELGEALGGEIQWDLTNVTHKRVLGGVYHIVVTNGPDNDSYARIAKLLVIN